MFERIVVPLDGSDVAEQALGPAAELARRLEIPLLLIRVTETPSFDVTTMFGYPANGHLMAEQIAAEMRLAREYLAENVRTMTDQGIQASSQVEVGLPAQEILEAVRPGDTIVMASHGRSGITRWYMGSVAEHLMRHAVVPVMVLRGPQRARGDRENSEVAIAS
jgi:nucleotide-binding universal stress UspA family protein